MATTISENLRNLFANEAVQNVTITVTPTSGEPFTITNADIVLGSFAIDRTIMEGSSLNLGSCVASELSMTLINYEGQFNGVVWSGAELDVELGVEGSAETISMGKYYVDRTPKSRSTISVSALDGMLKFDKPLSSATFWRYELEDGSISLSYLVNWCCTKCGVTRATDISGFPNATWSLWVGGLRKYLASDAGNFTYRDLLGWAVALMGKVAWMNGDGELEIGFPDKIDTFATSAIAGIAVVGTAIVGDSSGAGELIGSFYASDRYSSDYEDIKIEITGIVYTDSNTEVTYLIGTEDYAFDLNGNILLAFIQSCDPVYNPDWGTKNIGDMLNNLSDLIGFIYTPLSMTVVPCPYIFPADWVAYITNDDTRIYALVTNYTFALNGNNYISAQGEMPYEKEKASISSFGVIKNTVESMTDYVIDEGTTGGWYYRKWHGGRYECWTRQTVTVAVTTAWRNMYYGDITALSYPIEFTDYPILQVTGQTANGNAWVAPKSDFTKSSTGTSSVYSPTSITLSVTVNYYAQGSWR